MPILHMQRCADSRQTLADPGQTSADDDVEVELSVMRANELSQFL